MSRASATPHDRHHALLASLASDAPVLHALESAARCDARLPQRRSWRRVFARFDADGAPLVTLLYESKGAPQALVVASVGGPPCAGAITVQAGDPIGSVAFVPFPCDERLPTLPDVLATSPTPHVVRYRPRRRCTLRATRGKAVAFAKVFAGDEGRALDGESRRLHAASRSGALRFEVAAPLGWDGEQRTLWQDRLAGEPVVATLRGRGGPALAFGMGHALSSLATSEIGASACFRVAAQLERSERYVAALARQVPGCAERAHELLGALRRVHDSEGEGELRPIHGSPHVHQWLRNGERLGLVDFDRYALGEPELDLATFLAELDFEDRRRCDVEAVGQAFLDGYAQRGPAPNPRRLAAYRAHKYLSKALKAARALRPDGDRKAQRRLESAFVCLAAERNHSRR